MTNKLDELAQYADTHDYADEMHEATWEDDTVDDPMISTSIRLPKSLMDQVRTAASADGLKATAWIRRLVEREITHPAAQQPTPGEQQELERRVRRLEAALLDAPLVKAALQAVPPRRRATTKTERGTITKPANTQQKIAAKISGGISGTKTTVKQAKHPRTAVAGTTKRTSRGK